MSGETIVVTGTPKQLETAGASIASGALAVASVSQYDRVNDGANYPDAEFFLTGVQFATAPVEGATLMLFARPLSITGTPGVNAQAPEATRPTYFVGSFVVNDVTTSQNIVMNGLYAADVPAYASYYLYNYNTGQALSSGWGLTVTPRTRKSAP